MAQKNDRKKTANSTILNLGIVSFFADVASEMLYPVTPIFLTSVLGASVTSVGIIEGIAESIASLLRTYSGAWSDRLSKRKPFIFAGYLLGTISKPLIGISQSWTHVLVARAIDRTGKALRSAPRDALIADSVEIEHRGAAFGLHRGMDTFGAFVGPLLAVYFLNSQSDNLRNLYYWALIPGLLSVAFIFFIKEEKHEPIKRKWENPFRLWKQFDKPFKRYVYSWASFSLANSSDVFLLLKVKEAGFSNTTVILLYCAYNLTYSLSSPYLGKLSDTIGRKKLMMSGLSIFIFVYLGFSLTTQLWHFAVLFLIYGLYMGATEGVGKALAVDLAPDELKATSVGILGTVTGFCTIMASSVAGLLWDNAGASWPFYFGALGSIISLILLMGASLQPTSKTR